MEVKTGHHPVIWEMAGLKKKIRSVAIHLMFTLPSWYNWLYRSLALAFLL